MHDHELAHFFLTSKLETHVPYEIFVGYLRARSTAGRRFKAGQATSHRAIFYYSYVGGTKESIGYRVNFRNEVSISKDPTQDNKATINFKVPASNKIGYLLIGLFILFFSLRIIPEVGITRAAIVIAVIYFGIVVELNSQLYYFKDELESISNSYDKTIKYN